MLLADVDRCTWLGADWECSTKRHGDRVMHRKDGPLVVGGRLKGIAVLIQALAEKSAARSTASRLTSVSGLFYLVMGLTICTVPTVIPILFVEPAFTGREEGLFRLVGWIMAVVGCFLWIGGRSGARSFVAAGIVARLAVPLVAIPLAMNGVFPHMMIVFALLDPVSGLLTWHLLGKVYSEEPRDLRVDQPT
jgi:hypothetical protein